MNRIDGIFLAGVAAIAAGIAWLSPAAGLIAVGVGLVGIACLAESRKHRRKK
ncbi:MAG: hypothetical protein RBS99_12125 [Rhodospirillales bacterium]|nr:hypothetical protein [Rhodospirillales bacterium]